MTGAAANIDATAALLDVLREHRRLMDRLRAIADVGQTSTSEEITSALVALDCIYNDGIAIFGSAEAAVSQAERAGYLEASHGRRLLIGNFGQILRMVAEFYSTVQTTARRLGVTDLGAGIPNGDAYAAMQAVVSQFQPEWVPELHQLMVNARVPTVGFDEEPPPVKIQAHNAPAITISNNTGPTAVNVGTGSQIQQGATSSSKPPSLARSFLVKVVEAPGTALATIIGTSVAAYLVVHFGLK